MKFLVVTFYLVCIWAIPGKASSDCSGYSECLKNTTSYGYGTSTGKKYFVDTIHTVDWESARKACEDRGMKMARVTSVEENDELLRAIGRPYVEPVGEEVWIAGQRTLDGWIWNTTGEPITGYSYWLRGQPSNDEDEDCLAYFHRGFVDFMFNEDFRWNDKPCWMKGYIACEYY